jgi:hypothetical protein
MPGVHEPLVFGSTPPLVAYINSQRPANGGDGLASFITGFVDCEALGADQVRNASKENAPYLAPLLSPVVPVEACTLNASKSGSDVALTWTAATNATGYHIYRDTIPYFTPGTPYVTTVDTGFVDVGALGDPSVNHYYLVGAFNSTIETLCSNRVGEFEFGLTDGPGYLADIALPLDVSAVITDANGLADWVDANHIHQALKWNPLDKVFLSWSNEFGFGDNFATQTGDSVYLVVDEQVAPLASFVGLVPPAGSTGFRLVPGSATACNLNFLSLPLDRSDLTNADQFSDAVGGVEQALDWQATVQNFLAWANRYGFGDNFETSIGNSYAVCAGPRPPDQDAYVVETDPNGAYGMLDPNYLVMQGSRGASGSCATTRYTYLKFRLDVVAGQAATVTLTLNNAQYAGPTSGLTLGLYAVADDGWNENIVTWNNRPTVGNLLSQTDQVVGQNQVMFPASAALVTFINAERTGDGVASLALGWADCPPISAPQLRVDSTEQIDSPELFLHLSGSR